MFGKILSFNVQDNKVIIDFENQKGIVEVLSPCIIHLHEEKLSTFNLDTSKKVDVEFEVKESNHQIIITTTRYKFVIEDEFRLSVYLDGKLISSEKDVTKEEEKNFKLDVLEMEGHKADRSLKEHEVNLNKVVATDDVFYGLGDKAGFLNKRGYAYEMWNTDNPAPHVDHFRSLYKSIPFYVTLNKDYAYGFFVDNTYKQYYDMAKTHMDVVTISFDKGHFNYYFIGGRDLKEVVSNYTFVTGRTPLPQRWTLGYQQCRWSYMNKEEFMGIAHNMRKYHIPCDTLFLDIDYMERYKVFTYDHLNFEGFKEMLDELKKDGFKVVTIIDPGVKVEEGYNIYEEGIENHYFATENGETYVNQVWPGDAVYPSFISSKVRRWWGDNIKYLVDLGVDGVWNDMNEPASFKGPLPDNVEFDGDDGMHLHEEVHNVYGHYMAEATYNGLVKHTGKRPYVITRACYSGTQKYSTAWTGDNHSIWAHLQLAIPQVINLGISGFAFSGTDVGGFCEDATKELLIRWSQVGAFTPLFRNHSAMGTRYQEPWTFDEECLNIYRDSVRIRYHFIPYIYDLYHECEETGIPLFRPLVMNYPHDSNTFELNDEFMLGDNLLVAPVVKQGDTKKLVYLPEGKWIDYKTRRVYESGYHIVDAPLNTVPFFVKNNSILATRKVTEYIEEDNEITFEVFGKEAKYLHYSDNGTDFNYQNGEYNIYEVVVENEKVNVHLVHEGYKKYHKIIVKYEGKDIEITELNKDYSLN